MSIQVKRRREAASFLSAFTGAQAELIVDTTNNRLQVHDGTTAGGWPAAKLAEVQAIGRTTVADANYSVLATDVLVSMTALTASRTLTLPASSAYPVGRVLRILDESGAASASPQIVVAAQGTDAVDGGPSAVIQAAYGSMELVSNGAGKWFKLQDVIATLSNVAQVGIGTPADPNNPLSATLNAALFNALAATYGGTGDVRLNLNKQTAGNTASILYQDGFSGRAEIGLTGDDNFHFKVSPNGGAWTSAITIDATTGAATFANARTAVSDAAYNALVTDRLIAYTALTASRLVSLPAASAFPPGARLTILDESGSCSATKTIAITRAGSDSLVGTTSVVAGSGVSYALTTPYASVTIESNGVSQWTIVQATPQGQMLIRSDAITLAGSGALVIAGNVNSERFEIQSNIQPQFQGYYCGTSVDAPTPVQAGNVLFGLAGSGFNGSGRPGPFASSLITMPATENWSPTANGSAIAFITTPNGSPTGFHTERMRVDNSGYVGIGTTAPAAPLDVAGTIQSHAPNGSTLQFCVTETLVSLSGASTAAPIEIPANCILFSVAAYVVQAISGAPSYDVGTSANPTQFGGSLGVAAGASNFGLIGPEPFYAATPLLVAATSGSFTGGQVRLALHYMLLGGPTS